MTYIRLAYFYIKKAVFVKIEGVSEEICREKSFPGIF
jgi:hypothetical protein